MSGPVRAGAGAGPGAEAACPTENTPPPAAGPRLVASVGTSGKASNRRQGQPWGEPMRSKSSTNDAKDERELEPGATPDTLVSGGEPLSSQQTTLPPEEGRSTADVATTTISPTTQDSCTDTRNNHISIQVHRARSRTQRPLSGRHTNTPLAACANRRHNSGVRSTSRASSAYTASRSGGHVASEEGMHALSKQDAAKKSTLPPDHSQQPTRWKSPRILRPKSGAHRSCFHNSKNETEDNADAQVSESTSAAATAAAEAALDAAVSAAMEASDAAAAAAAAATAPAAMDTSTDAQSEDKAATKTQAPMAEFPRHSHTTSSQTYTPGRVASKPGTPVTQTPRSLVTMGHSHERLYAREGHRSYHHRSRSHRNSSRRRRRYESCLAVTGNCWDAAHLHARLGGANAPCMVFVWPRPSADVMVAATVAAQAAAEAGAMLRSKETSSDSTTVALTPARWLWRALHLLAMLHLWPVEEGLALGLMFKLPHLRNSLTQATCNDDSVSVLQEPQTQQIHESAEESEGQVASDRPDSPAIVAAAPCFPYTPSTTGYPATRVRPRCGIMEPH